MNKEKHSWERVVFDVPLTNALWRRETDSMVSMDKEHHSLETFLRVMDENQTLK